MRAAVIINPAAGRRPGQAAIRRRADLASAVLASHDVEARILLTERPHHARALAHQAVDWGASLVYAWGGDGTVNEVASALAFGPAALAIIPCGSGDGLARELGVPRRPERALAAALEGIERSIDVGELGGRLFVNVAGIGLDAHIAARFNAPGTSRHGLLSYGLLTIRALFSYRPSAYSITADGEMLERTALLVAIANSPQYGNGARIAPHARLDDGKLDLVVVGARSPLCTLLAVPRLFSGSVSRAGNVAVRGITEARIRADHPIAFHVDGEPCCGDRELVVRVHPRALRLKVPVPRGSSVGRRAGAAPGNSCKVRAGRG